MRLSQVGNCLLSEGRSADAILAFALQSPVNATLSQRAPGRVQCNLTADLPRLIGLAGASPELKVAKAAVIRLRGIPAKVQLERRPKRKTYE